MTEALVATVVGVVVSVALETIPGLKDKWTSWKYKPITMFLLFLLVPVIAWALTCYAGLPLFTTADCTWQGAVYAAGIGLLAFLANQTTFAVATRNTENAVMRNLM
jgi:hypothetical protein